MIKHRFRFFSLKTLVILGIVIAVTSVTAGYQTSQILHIEKSNQEVSLAQKRDAKIAKVAIFYMEQNPRLWMNLALYMAEHTVTASETYRVPLKIAVGVISAESTANPFAKSHTGAIGSTQVDFNAHSDTFPTFKTAREKYDPKNNIPAGMFLLQGCIKKYGLQNALQVYNLGEGSFRSGKRNWKYNREVLSIAYEFEANS